MFIQERGKVDQPPLECYHWMWIMWIYIEHKIWSPLSHFYLVEIYGRGEVFTNKEVYKSTIRTHTHMRDTTKNGWLCPKLICIPENPLLQNIYLFK
jgi:hypothetical protein